MRIIVFTRPGFMSMDGRYAAITGWKGAANTE